MAAATGKLWNTGLRNGAPVWLLEWELRQRLPRRVLLAVDTSDSCAQAGAGLADLFSALASTLELGDSCALWLLGRREKALETVIAHHHDRQRLAQNLAGSLTGVRGGTWMERTLDAMLAEAAGSNLAAAESFLLLASDGEIFDAEVLATRRLPRLGFVRLGETGSRQLGVIEAHTTSLTATGPALKSFLVSSPLAVELKHGWRGEKLVEFSGQGEITGELSKSDPLLVAAGRDRVRVAFVGGNEPQPQLLYAASGRSWPESRVERQNLSADDPAHLHLVVRALQGSEVEWDWARLKKLAADHRKEAVFDCPGCHRRKQLARRKLFCECETLLVASDGIKRGEALALYEDTVRFPVRDDGEVGRTPEAGKWDTGNDAYDVLEEDGQRWLVLNLDKR